MYESYRKNFGFSSKNHAKNTFMIFTNIIQHVTGL